MLAKRLEVISDMLEKTGSVEVVDLSKMLGVTEKTIRKDLMKLESMQIATRVHGGAVLKKQGSEIFPINQRKQGHKDEKSRIARAAYEMIEDGDTILLDSGTTTLELAKILDKEVIVITNDPFIIQELCFKEQVTLYLTGGRLSRERDSYTFVGDDAIRTIRNYRVNKCFAGVSGLDFDQGLGVFSNSEAKIKSVMIRSAREVILLCDYSKFHKQAFTSYAALSEVGAIITDDSITEEDCRYLEKIGIKVIVC